MTVTLYSHNDVGAPPLLKTVGQGNGSGTAIAVLKACLVDGYGAKPAAGWTEAFNDGLGTKAAFRNAITDGGTGAYYRINETTALDAQSRFFSIRGYEVMTSIDSGTGQFPTTSQMSGEGMTQMKNYNSTYSSNSWTGEWWVIADQHMCYMFNMNSTVANYGAAFLKMGDIISYSANDPYRAMLQADPTTAHFASQYSNSALAQVGGSGIVSGHYMMRDHTGLQTGIAIGQHADLAKMDGRMGYGSSYYQAFPNPVDGNLLVSNVFVTHNLSAVQVTRGLYPGMKASLHREPFSHLSTHIGSGDLAGREYMVFDVSNSSYSSQIMIEISDTWYT